MILDANERPLVPIHVCWSDDEANIVVSVLRDGGIESRTNSEVPHNVLPITTAGLGKVEVLVEQEFAEEARRVIEEHRNANPDLFHDERPPAP